MTVAMERGRRTLVLVICAFAALALFMLLLTLGVLG